MTNQQIYEQAVLAHMHERRAYELSMTQVFGSHRPPFPRQLKPRIRLITEKAAA